MSPTILPIERDWDALRKEIGAKVRALRTARLWTQAELAQRLALSQARLSEIERGLGSFSAEHLLELFQLFNVDASHFAQTSPDRVSQLQNALARLGAHHLVESESVLPSNRVAEVNDVVLEALVDARNPRLVTALAPVLVARSDEIRLDLVASRLEPLGLVHRLGWVVDNTATALQKLRNESTPPARAREHRRAHVLLTSWLERAKPKTRTSAHEDIVDPTIRSETTLKEAEQTRSSISRRWGIVSALSVEDFATALREAR